MKDEIIFLIEKLSADGITVNFSTRLVCKMTPHSPPVILHSISIDSDFDNMSKNTLTTILQRLKIMHHESSKN